MADRRRSSCPIAFALDLFGDRWSLLVLRDLVFEGKKSFQELLESDERIATNVLADRLVRLVEAGVIAKVPDPADRRRHAYAPTAKGLDLLPTMLEIVRWSARYDPRTGAPAAVVRELERDREALIARIRARFAATEAGSVRPRARAARPGPPSEARGLRRSRRFE